MPAMWSPPDTSPPVGNGGESRRGAWQQAFGEIPTESRARVFHFSRHETADGHWRKIDLSQRPHHQGDFAENERNERNTILYDDPVAQLRARNTAEIGRRRMRRKDTEKIPNARRKAAHPPSVRDLNIRARCSERGGGDLPHYSSSCFSLSSPSR